MLQATRIAAGLLLIFGMPLAGAAQDLPCSCDAKCASADALVEGLEFDHQMHRDWYEKRFWTGKCVAGLPRCFSGQGWFAVMDEVLTKPDVVDIAKSCERLFALGRKIGHEWGKDNDIRVIHSRDFRRWSRRLRRADDPAPILDEIEDLVATRLGAK